MVSSRMDSTYQQRPHPLAAHRLLPMPNEPSSTENPLKAVGVCFVLECAVESPSMARKKAAPYRHPLDLFLARDNNGTMLGYLASQYSEEHFDAVKYRNELQAKLKAYSY